MDENEELKGKIRKIFLEHLSADNWYGAINEIVALVTPKDDLYLMLDLFNSCIETKKFPMPDSPCQKKILKLLKQSGRKPTSKG